MEDFRVLKKKSGLSKRKLEKWFPLRDRKLFLEEAVYANVSNATTAYTLHLFDSTRMPLNKIPSSFALAWVLYVQPDGQIFAVFYKGRKKVRDHPVFAPALAALQQYVQANRRLSLEPGCYFSQCGTNWFEFE